MTSHPVSDPSPREIDRARCGTGDSRRPGRPAGDRPFASSTAYPWLVVGLLWFCGFFNYADRQAVNSVFPLLEKEFSLSDVQLGMLGSAFMVVYACTSPFAGYVVDRVTRRILIPVGLAVWSLIAAATGLSRSFGQLLFFRAAEGLGESFYFPASLSFLADYHGRATRSRALGIHQTSVYLGTAGGAVLAGRLAKHFGWRSPFLVLGLVGAAYALVLGFILVEPARGQSEEAKPAPADPVLDDELGPGRASEKTSGTRSCRILTNRAAVLLLCVFIGANFVAAAFLTWLPTFIYRKFSMDVADSSTTSTVWPLASLVGALCGGCMADLGGPASQGRADPGAEPGPDPGCPVRLPGRMVGVVLDAGCLARGRGTVQGHLRRQHLRLALRRRPPRGSRNGGGTDELGRLDRRLPGPCGRGTGLEVLRS